jgi:hypothetical protein
MLRSKKFSISQIAYPTQKLPNAPPSSIGVDHEHLSSEVSEWSFPWKRESRTLEKKTGFPASSAGQALLEFIPMKIGAGMT